jgi:hypothetical protein
MQGLNQSFLKFLKSARLMQHLTAEQVHRIEASHQFLLGVQLPLAQLLLAKPAMEASEFYYREQQKLKDVQKILKCCSRENSRLNQQILWPVFARVKPIFRFLENVIVIVWGVALLCIYLTPKTLSTVHHLAAPNQYHQGRIGGWFLFGCGNGLMA